MSASGRYLLDTNIIIALLEGTPAWCRISNWPGRMFLPVIAIGELLFGAAKSGRPMENAAKVERFAAGRSILLCDFNVARGLREKGRPIPENDIWICAIAACHELVLVTRDQHFRNVDGLKVSVW